MDMPAAFPAPPGTTALRTRALRAKRLVLHRRVVEGEWRTIVHRPTCRSVHAVDPSSDGWLTVRSNDDDWVRAAFAASVQGDTDYQLCERCVVRKEGA
ncbi:MAG: hypothetical protein HOQ45_03055 [Nocardioidaceae bacterium]|nr:hypothetical protein [Nocardioidaceae bacterium]